MVAARRKLMLGEEFPLVEQFRAASVKAEGKDALDVVDPDWESQHGHAHASLRYLCLGRYGPSPKPEEPPDYVAGYAAYDPDVGGGRG